MPPSPMAPARMNNPGGRAAAGAALGAVLGNGIGFAIRMAMFRKAGMDVIKGMPEVQATGPTPEAANAALDAEQSSVLKKFDEVNRRSQAVAGALATACAAGGAAAFANPGERGGAALGAAVGTGVPKIANVAFNLRLGMSGTLTGAGGAYLGASRAGR